MFGFPYCFSNFEHVNKMGFFVYHMTISCYEKRKQNGMLWFKLSNSLLTWPWRLSEPVMTWALPAGLLLFFFCVLWIAILLSFLGFRMEECSWNEITLRFLIPSLLMFPMSITVCRLLLVRCSVRWWTWLIQELCLCTRWQNATCDIFVFIKYCSYRMPSARFQFHLL